MFSPARHDADINRSVDPGSDVTTDVPRGSDRKADGMPVIEVENLHKTYGARTAVDDVSFSIEEGEIFGILGPNGAGKTTTVECVSGLRTPDSGRIRVVGLDPASEHAALTRVLGVQLQDSQLQPKITVREAMELWTAFYDDPQPWPELIERLGMGHQLDTRFAKLSGGQQQRLAIALALVGRPRVVILDELTTGLDPRARRETWELVRDVRDTGVTVVLVTHSMEEARDLCDRLAIIGAGRVVALDTPTGLVRRAGAGTVMSFVPSTPLDPADLSGLIDVASVHCDGDAMVVRGSDDSVVAVLSCLHARGVTPRRLRVSAGSLDDAYLDLTKEHA